MSTTQDVKAIGDRARIAVCLLQKALMEHEEWNEAHYCMVLDVLAAVSALSATEREREQRARGELFWCERAKAATALAALVDADSSPRAPGGSVTEEAR